MSPRNPGSLLLAHHKCILTQGAAYIQTAIIFFMGGKAMQDWVFAHYGVVLNVCWFIVAAVALAWIVGKPYWCSG